MDDTQKLLSHYSALEKQSKRIIQNSILISPILTVQFLMVCIDIYDEYILYF